MENPMPYIHKRKELLAVVLLRVYNSPRSCHFFSSSRIEAFRMTPAWLVFTLADDISRPGTDLVHWGRGWSGPFLPGSLLGCQKGQKPLVIATTL